MFAGNLSGSHTQEHFEGNYKKNLLEEHMGHFESSLVLSTACPGVQNPPKILLMEISTRFFDSLEGGDNVQTEEGVRAKRGVFFQSGNKMVAMTIK